MPLRYDPLLCRAFARDLDQRHGGRRTRELLLDRDRRVATLRFRDDPHLLALLHPEAGQVVESTTAHGEASFALRGLRLGTVRAPEDERLLLLELPPAGPEGIAHRIVLELHTNQWNLLLLREADDADAESAEVSPWRIHAALWPRRAGDRVLRPGRPYARPRGERRWRSDRPSREAWRDAFAEVPAGERRGTALRSVAWLSNVNVEHVLGPALASDDAGSLEEARRRYLALRDAAPEAWLLEREWGLQPYVRSLEEDDARSVPSLRAAMAASLRAEEGWGRYLDADGEAEGDEREPPEVADLRDALEARAARLTRRVEALERERSSGEDPADLRSIGDLLLARLGSVEGGREEVRLEGFDGETRTVDLDPSLAPAENAERYYEEAARRERALEKIPREIERAERSRDRVEEALRWLEERAGPPDREEIERMWELAGGRPPDGEAAGEDAERRPYRKLVTSGGLEVRVGRGAKSNEELTFHHSHTEDVWLHARQVPGAHVILRWGHREGNPPRSDLLQAAVAAAVHSDARHSGSVAVDWTRRKYVRSPRKSAPGAVIPRNVQTLFVEPDAAIVERMRRRAEAGSVS